MTTALLVFYSRLSRDRLERILRSQGIEVYLISGRAPDAAETVRRHPADVVVIDKDVADISVTQAVRHIAQILPRSPIFTASANHQRAEVYRKGRHVGNQLLVELHVLLDSKGVLLLESGEVTEGHQGAGMPEVILESLGVSGLAQPLDGI